MKIICIGRNYADHAKELNNPVPEEPLFFIKPDTALLRNNDPFVIPAFTKDLHYEVEVYVKIKKKGKNISVKFAPQYYSEVGLGIDLTARDVQARCKEKGWPWEKAKAFDGSAPVSETVPLATTGNIDGLSFELKRNGETVQRGYTGDMIYSMDQIINHASKFFTLRVGDLIFSGTPAGVGKLEPGDRLEGYLEGLKMFDFKVR